VGVDKDTTFTVTAAEGMEEDESEEEEEWALYLFPFAFGYEVSVYCNSKHWCTMSGDGIYDLFWYFSRTISISKIAFFFFFIFKKEVIKSNDRID
jgi:lipocalin